MRITVKIRRRVWLRIFIGLVAIAAIIAVATVYFGGRTNPAAPNAVATPTSSPASEVPVAVDAAPTGCLGGPDRTAAMVLAAQQAAPYTTNGAIEVAAAFTRWIQRFPYPAAQESEAVGTALLARDSFTNDLTSYLDGSPDLSGGMVQGGTDYYMSTVPGIWKVESSSPDRVEVTVGSAFVVDGALSPTLKSSITVVTVWENGHWKIAEANGTRTTQDLYAAGSPFAGGC